LFKALTHEKYPISAAYSSLFEIRERGRHWRCPYWTKIGSYDYLHRI